MLNADIIRLYAPRFADGETAPRRQRHELQLDPFAALFEVAKSVPVVLLTAFPSTHPRAPLLTASFWRANGGRMRPPLHLPVWPHFAQ